jgi:hypothetical protein
MRIYDSGDLDAILELERSRGYALVMERITDELERQRLQCEQPSETWTTHYAQGQVKGLRTARAIPEILRAEIRDSLTE